MDVQHDNKRMCFFVKLEEVEAKLSYRKEGPGQLNFYSTFVPSEARGKGLAKLLTEAGLEYARSNGLKVIPGCSYVETYFQKHPEAADLMVKGSGAS